MLVQGPILRIGPQIPADHEQHRVRWNLPGEENEDFNGNESENGDNNNEEEGHHPTQETYPMLKLATLNIVDGIGTG